MTQGGVFITFEGVEGSGKSTQIELLARHLKAVGTVVVVTREPGDTDLGRRLRAVLMESDGVAICPAAELALYAADRAQHLVEVVEPALRRGKVVLCDRYLDATLAYQGFARGLGVETVLRFHRAPPLDRRPHRTVLLNLDPAEALRRARRRNDARGATILEGKYESEPEDFHRLVREGYLELARREPERIRVVDAGGTPEDVALRVRHVLEDVLPPAAETPP